MIADPYRILGIREDATDQELKKAYRDLSKKYHPDANPNDPKAAEEKFKEIQEAYRQITDARERGVSAYGPRPQSSPSSGASSQGNTGYGNAYREYSNASSAFDDFFTQWRRAQESTGQTSGSYDGGHYENVIRAAVNFINTNRYQEALNALNGIAVSMRDAQWYYVSAIANQGVGNNITAMQYAKRAVDMDPSNILYAQLLQRLQGGGARYQSRGAAYSPTTVNPGWCVSMIALNLFCNVCGGGCYF